MSDITNAAESLAAEAEPTPPTMEEAKALAESGEAEGTTPEEVAQVLKSSGINIPAADAAAAEDEEEGDEPEPAPEPAPADEEVPPESAEEKADEEEEPEPAEPPKPEPAKEEPAAATDDKYAFEVTDANGVTFKITADAKMEDVLAEFEPKNNGQIIDILDQLRDVKEQKAKDEADQADTEAKTAQDQRVADIRANWDKEIVDLKAQKRIPAGDEGEARVKEVYQFMAEENDARIKAGRPTIGGWEDALDKLEAKENREKAAEEAKAEKESARKKGALVGGSSGAPSSGAPAYKAGSARNANEAIRAMGLLE